MLGWLADVSVAWCVVCAGTVGWTALAVWSMDESGVRRTLCLLLELLLAGSGAAWGLRVRHCGLWGGGCVSDGGDGIEIVVVDGRVLSRERNCSL